MADLATLGLAVDSSQVKTATAELDKLSTAAVKTGVSTAALEAGAKRLGISVEEYRKRVEGAVPATEQLGAAARAQAAAWAALQPVLSGVSGQLLALSAGAGPVGVFLSALGPWGVAASVGIGALSSAFNAMIEGANHIGDKSVEIKKFSDVTGLTVGQIKGLTTAGAALGVSSDQVTEAVERFSVGLDDARKGTGPLFDKLREINPALARQLSETRTTAQGWDILSQAIRAATNEAQRNALARAAFGRGGLEAGLVAISTANAGGIDAQAGKISKATGLTAQWVTETARLRNENIQLEKSITTMMESTYALPVLQRQNEFLRVQKEIAAAILATGRTREGVRVGPTGEPEMSPTPDIPDIPEAPSVGVGGENARTSNREMAAAEESRAQLLQDTIRQNNLDKERIGLLGDLIGKNEALALKTRELKAAQLEGKISTADLDRATALLKEMEDSAARHKQRVDEIAASYAGVSREVAQVLNALATQLPVAQAIGGAARMQAQEQATINTLIDQDKTSSEAMQVAAAQRAQTQAQVNAGAQAQLQALSDQYAVASSRNAVEAAGAQSAATMAQMIRDGVDATLAGAAAGQQWANALAQVQVAAEKQLASAQDQYAVSAATTQEEKIRAQTVARRNELDREGNPLADQIAQQEEMNKLVELQIQEQKQRDQEAAQAAKEEEKRIEERHQQVMQNYEAEAQQFAANMREQIRQNDLWIEAAKQRGGRLSFGDQFADSSGTPNQYQSTVVNALGRTILDTFGGGGKLTGSAIGATGIEPSAEGWDYFADALVKRGSSIQDIVGKIIKESRGVGGITDATSQIIDKLTDMLPDADKITAIQKELEEVRRQPISLAREKLIKDLNDQLKQLTDATESLTATMDPLFTGGHEALRIGYYNEGGSAGAKYYGDTSGLPTATGSPAGASQPITVPSGGWGGGPIADANYYHAATGFEGVVSGFGGTDSTPIHIMATPGERIKLTPSGSNGASVTNIYQSINFPMSALGETRRSARQMAEGFRRAVN